MFAYLGEEGLAGSGGQCMTRLTSTHSTSCAPSTVLKPLCTRAHLMYPACQEKGAVIINPCLQGGKRKHREVKNLA